MEVIEATESDPSDWSSDPSRWSRRPVHKRLGASYMRFSTSLDFRRRQQKLVQSNRSKTGPGKAVAGRPVASVA